MHETRVDQFSLDATAHSPDLAALLAATKDIFGGAAILRETFAPEFPGDKYLQISVQTKLEPEQIVRAESVWISAMMRISPTWEDIRLKIEPV